MLNTKTVTLERKNDKLAASY